MCVLKQMEVAVLTQVGPNPERISQPPAPKKPSLPHAIYDTYDESISMQNDCTIKNSNGSGMESCNFKAIGKLAIKSVEFITYECEGHPVPGNKTDALLHPLSAIKRCRSPVKLLWAFLHRKLKLLISI